uniref:At1g61320/AtMIF1 LRR domain-containing protein n=1 Tax=Arundo donax TaxID=35708 RepID=A0A0A9FK95_ARUDO
MKLTFANAKRFGKNAILQLAYLLEAAPFLVYLHLDMLCVSFCEDPPKRDVIIDRPHHNLKRACITGFNGNGGQVALVKYILRNAVQLERLTIDPRGRIMDQMMGKFHGRISAKYELMPEDKNGVLTVL